MTKQMKYKFKPVSFDTTMRNPERIVDFLECLSYFEGQTLTNEIIYEVIYKVIGKKIYQPNYARFRYSHILNNEEMQFTREELEDIVKNSPQEHKEAGFDKGWPSRFKTWYSFAKELGFVWFKINEPIRISQTGHILINSFKNERDGKQEQLVFLNAMSKYHTNTPFRRNLINNIPLVLLLKVLELLKKDNSDSTGINRQEIPFFLCWKNDNADELYRFIKDFRKLHSFSRYTDEIIYNACLDILGFGDSDKNYVKLSKITSESVDDYIRKMRITGIFSLRGNGRFIDINTLEKQKVNHILQNYKLMQFSTEEDCFKYMEQIDPLLMAKEDESQQQEKSLDDLKIQKLKELASYWNKDYIKKELKYLTNRTESKDIILRTINGPTRLEFLISIALVQNFVDLEVYPNYSIDDEGLPITHAGGNKPDIICKDKITNDFVEVSLITDKNGQINNEMLSITRHQKIAKESNPQTYSLFIAPRIHEDTRQYCKWVKFSDEVTIKPFTVEEFLTEINSSPSLDFIVLS